MVLAEKMTGKFVEWLESSVSFKSCVELEMFWRFLGLWNGAFPRKDLGSERKLYLFYAGLCIKKFSSSCVNKLMVVLIGCDYEK